MSQHEFRVWFNDESRPELTNIVASSVEGAAERFAESNFSFGEAAGEFNLIVEDYDDVQWVVTVDIDYDVVFYPTVDGLVTEDGDVK